MIDKRGDAGAAGPGHDIAACDNEAPARMDHSGQRQSRTPQGVPLQQHRNKRARGGASRRALVFAPERLVEYTRGAILDELRRVASLVVGAPLTRQRFDRVARVSSAVVVDRFGTWRRALDRAGLLHRHITRSSAGLLRMDRTQHLTKKQIAAELRALALTKSDGRLRSYDVADSETLSLFVIRRRFGQWSSALKAAGLRAETTGRRYSNAELYANLMRLWKRRRRAPRAAELQRPPSRITAVPYIRRFGTWNRAIAAFAALAAGGASPDRYAPPDRSKADATAKGGRSKAERAWNARRRQRDAERARRRDLPPATRYRILLRDDFRCAACGDSPAITRGCRLQIDHVVPFSKGGRTEPANLRTLCQRCNIGRGAKGEERAGARSTPAARRSRKIAREATETVA